MTKAPIRLLLDSYHPPVRLRTGAHYLLWASFGHRAQVQVSVHRRWLGWRYFSGRHRWRLEAGWISIMVS